MFWVNLGDEKLDAEWRSLRMVERIEIYKNRDRNLINFVSNQADECEPPSLGRVWN